MTVQETAYAVAAAFLGELNEDEQAVLQQLCAAAEAHLTARLMPGVTAADCQETLAAAAGWLALGSFCAGQDADGVESFAASDLSISRSMAAGSALISQAEAMMGPYTSDGFAFLGVRA